MNMGVCECLCSQFSPTQEELDAVVKCKNEVVVSSIKYPLFFGVVAGSVSYRLKLVSRAFSIAVASAFGLEYGRRKAEYACMKHFISLDHSPIKSTLVDILQKDFPDHPLLREVAQRDSSRFGGDETSEYKNTSERKEDAAFPATPRGLSTLAESPSEYGAEDHEAQPARPRHMINRRELRISRRQLPDSREPEKPEAFVDATDVLVDPFSLGVWSEGDDNRSDHQENQQPTRREWRRSRMTSEEKREHNRRLREQREKERRGQQRQPNSMS
ncbi:hypothetical protein M758_9G025000 [Ceratodon purpureus]|uniref:Uncharacterized protein n=1 Tax=Ceratodon purpureus TaxID=3225 RepID=A0A8T0GMZ5_CERPU|nr:hypothetical protein KC19_9G024300 [Ceratodon purpureus]KAG0605003.1 hypothetical protein M758_9G025000 [Ceratodon purpureus]